MSNEASQGWYVCYAETLEKSSNVDSNPLQRLGKKKPKKQHQGEPTRCLFIFWHSWDFPASLMTPSGSDSLGWNGRACTGWLRVGGQGLPGDSGAPWALLFAPREPLSCCCHTSAGGSSQTQGCPSKTARSWCVLGNLVHVEMVCMCAEGVTVTLPRWQPH